MSNNINPYQQTINDLELRRTRCLDDLRKIEAAITSLRAVNIVSAIETVAAQTATPSEIEQEVRQRYAHMSVRWAVLKFLCEGSLGRAITADIAAALREGGNPKASNATVSAVISDMVNKRQELFWDHETDGFAPTATGRSAWLAIKNSARYLNRSSASEQTQPE